MCEATNAKQQTPMNHQNKAFDPLWKDFDAVLKGTIENMEHKGSEDATITVKIDLSLTKEDVGGYDEKVEITKPSLKHQVSSVMQVKSKRTGHFNDDCEIVFDPSSGEYVTRPISSPQMSFFEGEEESEYHAAEILPLPPAYSEEDVNEYPELHPVRSANCCEVRTLTKENADAFDCLLQFVGKPMHVVNNDGNYSLRTEDNNVILSSESDESNIFHCDREILKTHEFCEIECVGYCDRDDDNDDIDNICIECADCAEPLYSLDKYFDEYYAEAEATDITEASSDDGSEADFEDVSDDFDDETDEYGYDGPEDDDF